MLFAPSYVMDTSSLKVTEGYYPDRFPSFWAEFNPCVDRGEIISVREVFKELEIRAKPLLWEWANNHKDIFAPMESEESPLVSKILKTLHFQHLVDPKIREKSWPAADPFIIAKAEYLGAAVVTQEANNPNGQRIPNACERFGVKCMTFQEFMQEKKWVI